MHASPAALPEVPAGLGGFPVRLRRPEGRAALARDTTGLRTERPMKHGDAIAPAVPGTMAQRWPECLTNRLWDEEDLRRQRVQKMVAEAARGGRRDGPRPEGGLPGERASPGPPEARQYSWSHLPTRGAAGRTGRLGPAAACAHTVA